MKYVLILLVLAVSGCAHIRYVMQDCDPVMKDGKPSGEFVCIRG